MLPGGNQNENIIYLMYGGKHRLSRISRKKCIQIPNKDCNTVVVQCGYYIQWTYTSCA